jgi:hypothetical protein
MIKKKFNIKGFIGSIGDDLPSLIPLFFALMIFFGALAFAFTTINEKNSTINTYIDSLTIAKSALSDGAFASLSEFNETQSSFVTLSNYMYGLIYLPDDAEYDFESLFEYDVKDIFVKECDNNKSMNLYADLYVDNTGLVDSDPCSGAGREWQNFLIASPSALEKINVEEDSYGLLQEIKNRKYFYYLYPVTILTPVGQKVVYLIVLVW